MKSPKFCAAAALAVSALVFAPLASAQPLPNPPEPGVPEPVGSSTGCMEGEIFENGSCVSAMTSPATGGETRIAAPSVGGVPTSTTSTTSTTNSYLDPMHTVPNINGDPCTGQWESVACYAMNFDTAPAVQPRSTISSSP